MKVFILLSLVAGALAVLDCPVHQHYESCGTACPLTCDNHNDPPQGCILLCNPGCHCDPGYVKTKSGSCVKPESCNKNEVCTGENQRYNECGTACPLTCDNYQNPPKACTKECAVGCECQEGYVKNKQGECVLPSQCPSFALSLCELEAETGMCKGYFHRYFFNKASGKCEKFVYGGCGGNENNFKTFAECHNSCATTDDVCGENEEFTNCGTACPLTCDNFDNPPMACTMQCVIGCHCQMGYVRNAQGKCVPPEQCPSKAVCGENQEFQECGTACPLTCDNFSDPPKICTMQCIVGCACQKGYVKNAQKECVLPEQCPNQAESLCQLKADAGKCMAYIERYHFNKAIGQCEKFVYGGCGGNANNFKTLKECQDSCQTAHAVQNALDRPDCDKAPETGDCKAMNTRWYYDQEEGMCKIFIYGGCGGNRNNFESRDECYNKCGALVSPKNALCAQEKEVGPCKAAFQRYFYNQKTGACEQFIYGGCRGNGNNFLSKEDCHATCLA